MAVTGVFAADFSAFDKAVQSSQARLQGFEGAASSVESSLRVMTRSQEQVLDQIGAAGGRIGDVAGAATAATGPVTSLGKAYQQFDGVLQAAGINIGPQIKGLEDIAAASGKTATQLGALGTAGLAAGAFMTGWKIGEFIDGLTGASSAVESLVTQLMGYQSLTGETAGAKQDVINRAIRDGAAATISYTEAIKFNNEQSVKAAAQHVDWRAKLAESQREVRNLTAAQREDIAIMLEAGATTADVTTKYGIHAKAVEILTDRISANTAAQKKLNEERAKDRDAAEERQKNNQKAIDQMNYEAGLMADRAKFDKEQAELQKQKLAGGKALFEAMTAQAKITKDATEFEKAFIAEQAKLDAETAKLTATITAQGAATDELGAKTTTMTTAATAGYAQMGNTINITADGIRGLIAMSQYNMAANAILGENSLFTTKSQRERIAALPIPSFASGVENFGGGLAKVHGGEVLANLPTGTSVFPRGSGFGATVNNTFNLVDSESNLARRVAELIMRQIRAGTQLGTT